MTSTPDPRLRGRKAPVRDLCEGGAKAAFSTAFLTAFRSIPQMAHRKKERLWRRGHQIIEDLQYFEEPRKDKEGLKLRTLKCFFLWEWVLIEKKETVLAVLSLSQF